MAQLNQFVRYAGGTVAFIGLAISAAFIGPRTADPIATVFFQSLSLWMRIIGIFVGLAVLAVGLRIVGAGGAKD